LFQYNSKAGEKYKSAAQGLITLATYGVGMLVGFAVAGWITDNYKMLDGTTNWQMVGLFLQVSHSSYFYYLHSYLILKKKEIKLFNKIIMSSNLSRRSVLKV
jgi:MFS family permease